MEITPYIKTLTPNPQYRVTLALIIDHLQTFNRKNKQFVDIKTEIRKYLKNNTNLLNQIFSLLNPHKTTISIEKKDAEKFINKFLKDLDEVLLQIKPDQPQKDPTKNQKINLSLKLFSRAVEKATISLNSEWREGNIQKP